MLFGPVMVVWFITIGVLGLTWISRSRGSWPPSTRCTA